MKMKALIMDCMLEETSESNRKYSAGAPAIAAKNAASLLQR
jgi:hypothetical protein